MTDTADVLIVGAGAAGLMAGIWAGRTYPERRIFILDGARKLGAKILVSGGGRCNVTHDIVDENAFAGSSRHAIKKVLRRFDVPQVVQFFHELGVDLKREETGKLFPVTDDAGTVLAALLQAAHTAGVCINHPHRVDHVEPVENGFRVSGSWGNQTCRSLVLATGGKSLPKTGSDGGGYALAQLLGHSVTSRIFPALVPLMLPSDHFICRLSGLTLLASIELYSSSGAKRVSFTDSTLCTHFGLSGPSVLDFSRYYLAAQFDDPGAMAVINWLPQFTPEQFEAELQQLGKKSPLKFLERLLPHRLAYALCEQADVTELNGSQLARSQRKALVSAVTRLPLPITGSRGYTYAEVTAGGVPLSELNLARMESRITPRLHFCGEICDVDGRIGGYNFQWAWASGYAAGVSVGH